MSDERQWLEEYLARYRRSIFDAKAYASLLELKGWLTKARDAGNKVIIVGNGGNAATASHCAVDLTKNAGVRCVNFNEPDLITCFANDFGYEQWVAKALEFYAEDNDVVILLSASGCSPNMLRAAEYALKRRLRLATFTGCSVDNRLRSLGELNLWVDSRAYNVVEMTHQIWLLAVCDLIIGRAEYPAS